MTHYVISVLTTRSPTTYHLTKHIVNGVTIEQYRNYVANRFGYTEKTLLMMFENEFKADGNGVYTVNCGHGFSPYMMELTSIVKSEDTYSFTYTPATA